MPTAESPAKRLRSAMESLEIALPPSGDGLEQDEEWVVVHSGREWKKIRLHDYGDVYSVQGLYERWVYDLFKCRSPEKIRELLTRSLRRAGVAPASLTVLDLGAGNGCVAEELARAGTERFVGVDIYDEAAEAAERDRPGLYDDYVIGDLTRPDNGAERTLRRHEFNAMTCVAALGFGDIPPEVFAAAHNRVEDSGWIAFTIKSDFMDDSDKSGFSRLIRRMISAGTLEVTEREEYDHRVSNDGEPLRYTAFVGRKHGNIPEAWLQGLPRAQGED